MERKEKIRILLVEDDEEDYIIVKDLFSNVKIQQYLIDWAESYETAMDKIEKNFYDLLLVDYNLGGKTGLDLIDNTADKTSNIPVIILTGQNDRDVDILAMQKGVSDYLVKGSFDSDLLERSIRHAIEKKEAENQILYLAYYDQVTDLPNRIFFKEQLNHALAQALRYNRIMAVLFLDLDNFKLINDSLGHHIGDLVLKEVAQRLRQSIRKSDIIARNNQKTLIDTVARLGGDEFTISLTEINSYVDASLVAERIIKSINEPFHIEDHEIFVGVSIGISLCPEDTDDSETLLKYADNAMYYAKKKGKNDFQFFQKSMNEIVQETINMSNKMRTALDRNEFLLYYQPKMNIKSGKIVGFEALIRWNQGDKGIVFPRDFIPFAEDHNLISFVTNWVINDVCRQLCEWGKAELNLLPVSINLPINQFNKQDFVPYLTKITDSYNISPKLIELEVTESIFMDDMKSTNSKLNELISMGFQIAIDDFGSGFSSLNRLKEIPCNIIKIERSFIESINDNTPDNVIVSSIILMGHGLNMEVQAEGVENEIQYKFLELNHCDTLQGFILSPPVPAEEIRTILKKESEGKGIGIKLANKMRR